MATAVPIQARIQTQSTLNPYLCEGFADESISSSDSVEYTVRVPVGYGFEEHNVFYNKQVLTLALSLLSRTVTPQPFAVLQRRQ